MKKFTTRIRARYCETDAAQVIYYGSFMHYFEVGKMEMYRELGIPYRADIPILETYCRYPSPAFFDDLLEIHTWFDDIRSKGFKIRSEVYRVVKEHDLVLVGEGYTTHIYVNEDRVPTLLPDHYVQVFDRIGATREDGKR
ncbi:MAG: acyl-CoA thioesterase [Candidatus Latescibacterota bacterium]|nr:MAG: acyl-CoA thioesterase [Candidatus Latescibacterota bacterium]